jgi:CubicO group peptidase (beta-lactamase class C family)
MVDRRSFVAGLAASAIAVTTRVAAVPSESDVIKILRQRVDEKRTVGMAAAVVTGRSRRTVCYGAERLGSDRKVSDETLFEIGSITKVFTALLLVNLARDGRLAIDDPAAKHLPSDFKLPERDGRAITLADLATHTAGLPRMPAMKGSPLEAMKLYTVAEMQAWLAAFQLPRTPGSAWEYSNLGYALLGLALAHRTDRPFDELLKREILGPLALANTFLTLPPSAAARLAEGHDGKLNPLPPFEAGVFGPAGGVRSTIKDLALFVSAVMPGSGSSLEPSAQRLLQTLRPAPAAGGQQALGWEVLAAREGDYVSKDGVTAGQCATAVYDPAKRTGVVVLSNTFPQFGRADTSPSGGGTGAGDIARHLLRPSIPLGA